MRVRHIAPGVGLAVVLAVFAKLIVQFSSVWGAGKISISPVLCAAILGVIWRNAIGVSGWAVDGLQWVVDVLLRVGIALVGLRLTLMGATEIAAVALPVVVGCISIAVLGGALMARAFGVPTRLGFLLAVGTAVCGCTAVVALSPVIRAKSAETGYALACVVLFGCIGMILYPMLAGRFFAFSDLHAGVFLGTSIHDTSQVIGSALIYSQQAGAPEALAAASVTKLIRNLSMAVLIPLASWQFRGSVAKPGVGMSVLQAVPLFVVGFVLLVVVRTLGDAALVERAATAPLWTGVVTSAQSLSDLFLICGMAAVGLSVSFGELRSIGGKPLAAGLVMSALVATCSLLLTLAVSRW
jgi:uncharacterized integral membrane protein (TIGR00698 family)